MGHELASSSVMVEPVARDVRGTLEERCEEDVERGAAESTHLLHLDPLLSGAS
jgi:hypothetical protein